MAKQNLQHGIVGGMFTGKQVDLVIEFPDEFETVPTVVATPYLNGMSAATIVGTYLYDVTTTGAKVRLARTAPGMMGIPNIPFKLNWIAIEEG